MQFTEAMIRKRIEIVLRISALSLALAPGLALSVKPALRYASDQAHAYPVYLEPEAVPVPLPPLPGVAESAVQVSVRESPATAGDTPDVPYTYFWRPQDGLQLRANAYARQYRVSEHSPGLLGGFDRPRVATSDTRWLPTPGTQAWAFGERNWRRSLEEGPDVLLGSSEIAVPEWNESVRLGGISLSQSFMASSDDVSAWNYALAFGAVDQSGSSPEGDLVFGPTAGSLALSYDYSPQFSLESQTQVADDLIMSGITGQYDLGSWGRWRSGIARSTQGATQGWRYRAMADFDLPYDTSLAWVGERYTDGFMDIRRYADGANSIGGARQRWSASWDVGRWGEWSGSFESRHGREGILERRFGVSQQFWYSPNLKVGLHAEREVVGGDYDIGLRFSFPLY